MNKKTLITLLFIGNFLWLGILSIVKFLPQSVDTTLVLVNQIGYYPFDDNKRVLLQIDRRPIGFETSIPYTIQRLDSTSDISIDSSILEGNLTYLGELWNHSYYEANISRLRTEGRYRIQVNADKEYYSPPFNISSHLIDQSIEMAYHFFYYQRCGCAINSLYTGYPGHGLCHADDANLEANHDDSTAYRNLSGGWHDAGDYNKYCDFTPFSVYSLIQTYENNPIYHATMDRTADYKNTIGCTYQSDGVPDVIEESMWGADFLVKSTNASGCMVARVGSNDFHGWYGYTGRPEEETDNDPSTPKDNRKYVADAWYPVYGITALLKLYRILTQNNWNLEKAQKYYDTAMLLLQYYVRESQVNNEVLTAYLELYIITHNQTYLDRANQVGMTLLNNSQTIKYPGFAHCGVDEVMRILSQWAQVNGSQQVKMLVSQAFEDRWTHFWSPMAFESDPSNYFHILKANTTKGNEFYFYPWRLDGWNVGQNSYYLSAAASTLLGYNLTGNSKYLNFALRQFDWVLGLNPFGICMFEGLGTKNPAAYHNRYRAMPGNIRGAIPGCVPNGIIRQKPTINAPGPDAPWFDLTEPTLEEGNADYASNEPWIPHNAFYLLASSELQAFLPW